MLESNLFKVKPIPVKTRMLLHLNGNVIDEVGHASNGLVTPTYVPNQKFGKSAVSFGLNGYVSFAYFQDLHFVNDFTIEMFVSPANVTEQLLLSANAGCYFDFLQHPSYNAGRPSCFFSCSNDNTHTEIILGETPWTSGVPHHIAVSRLGATARMFWDGNLVGTSTITSNWAGDPAGGLCVGNYGQTPTLGSTGTLQEIRFSNVCRYTANFTPPIAPFIVD